MPVLHACRAADSVCDAIEYCPGDGPDCPDDQYKPFTESCRPIMGDCDIEDFCPGDGVNCGEDIYHPEDYVCREAAGRISRVRHTDERKALLLG